MDYTQIKADLIRHLGLSGHELTVELMAHVSDRSQWAARVYTNAGNLYGDYYMKRSWGSWRITEADFSQRAPWHE